MTGHRGLADPDEVGRRVAAALDACLSGVPAGQVEVWSSLAEGADRIVAHKVLERPGARLVAVLPLDPDEYRADFTGADSLAEFDELLALADRVEVTGPDASGSRTSAYERAGHVVLDRCEVLLALWDGEPARGRGGTAEIVAEARSRGVRVIEVPVERAEGTR